MPRRLTLLVLGLVLTQGGVLPSAQSPTLKSAMRDKLQNTQQLLEAVITVDFESMNRSAERLSRISYTEVSSWQSAGGPDYVFRAEAFISSVTGLREAVASRNIERATSEYVALISSCVQCHTYVRKSRVVTLTPPAPILPAVPRAVPQ